MSNIEYFVKERAGLPTYGVEKYITTVTSDDRHVFVPRGFLPKLIAWLDEHETPYLVRDERITAKPIEFKSKFELFDFQKSGRRTFTDAEERSARRSTPDRARRSWDLPSSRKSNSQRLS